MPPAPATGTVKLTVSRSCAVGREHAHSTAKVLDATSPDPLSEHVHSAAGSDNGSLTPTVAFDPLHWENQSMQDM